MTTEKLQELSAGHGGWNPDMEKVRWKRFTFVIQKEKKKKNIYGGPNRVLLFPEHAFLIITKEYEIAILIFLSTTKSLEF